MSDTTKEERHPANVASDAARDFVVCRLSLGVAERHLADARAELSHARARLLAALNVFPAPPAASWPEWTDEVSFATPAEAEDIAPGEVVPFFDVPVGGEFAPLAGWALPDYVAIRFRKTSTHNATATGVAVPFVRQFRPDARVMYHGF